MLYRVDPLSGKERTPEAMPGNQQRVLEAFLVQLLEFLHKQTPTKGSVGGLKTSLVGKCLIILEKIIFRLSLKATCFLQETT